MRVGTSGETRRLRKIERQELQDAPGRAIQIADLIFEAAPEFYGLVPGSKTRILEILSHQIGRVGGELEDVYGLYQDEAPLAICSVLPSQKLAGARMRSATWILKELDKGAAQNFVSSIRQFGQQTEEIESTSLYIGRMAVCPEARGVGIGRTLMTRIIELHPESDISLHVYKGKPRVIDFYVAAGFRFQSENQVAFRAMILER